MMGVLQTGQRLAFDAHSSMHLGVLIGRKDETRMRLSGFVSGRLLLESDTRGIRVISGVRKRTVRRRHGCRGDDEFWILFACHRDKLDKCLLLRFVSRKR